MIKVLRGKDLEIRNSPLDRVASLAGKAIYCIKDGCENVQAIGISVGLLITMDAILE